MSDWDFLHDMHARGCSPDEIADAAAIGYDPDTESPYSRDWFDDELADQTPDDAEHLALQAREGRAPFQSRGGFPYSMLEQIELFSDLVNCAQRHFANTGRYLQVWGELGEIYAEIKFGLRRHGTHEAGSDGTIGGRLVEVKTISPEKYDDQVMVKAQGNFQQLLIVRIDENFEFTGKLLERNQLSDGGGRFLRARLQDHVDGDLTGNDTGGGR